MPQPRALRPLLLFAALVAGVIPAFRARAGTVDASDPIPVLPDSRILSPGPRTLGFDGLAADPSTIGNFRGLVALAYVRGRVRDATGRQWLMMNDIRLFQGDYVSADGIQRRGAFAFVWIELIAPGSGPPVHDFNGGITPAGLVWTVRLPGDALTVVPRGNLVTVDARDVTVVDDRAAPAGETPATVSFHMTWTGRGGRRRLAAGSPAFAGQFFRHARAHGTFSAAEDGFGFASDARRRARSTFAELGTEQNGLFLAAATECPRCGAP